MCHSSGRIFIDRKIYYKVYHGSYKGKAIFCSLGNFEKVIKGLDRLHKLKPHVLPLKDFLIAKLLFRKIEKLQAPQNTLDLLQNLEVTSKVLLENYKELEKTVDSKKLKSKIVKKKIQRNKKNMRKRLGKI
jgi:hypothetical protein